MKASFCIIRYTSATVVLLWRLLAGLVMYYNKDLILTLFKLRLTPFQLLFFSGSQNTVISHSPFRVPLTVHCVRSVSCANADEYQAITVLYCLNTFLTITKLPWEGADYKLHPYFIDYQNTWALVNSILGDYCKEKELQAV